MSKIERKLKVVLRDDSSVVIGVDREPVFETLLHGN